ncbi:MAG: UDP-N-acetylmuramoyl-tripeptide--D-alanyl-D-alanine ligase [Candidatus Saelkia tenebricola]|nr:UDP-N-acetylmuramoyl-tripeptide--D-alanyl-D-alanine ligase [Candidatus Saelkia tenebricola]
MSFELSILEISKNTEGELLRTADEDSSVESFSIDTRTFKKGDCFIALKGTNFNGHDFISNALRKGAVGIIYDEDIPSDVFSINKNVFFIKVSDAYKAIAQLARYKRKKMNFPVLAITGSSGKTTVKELVAEFLSSRYSIYKSYLNQNNVLGLSLNILNCSCEYEFAVFELGISKFAEMDVLLDILKPDHGLITNIGFTHIEYLKQESSVFQEKIKLFKSLDSNAMAFYSLDNIYAGNVKKEYSKSLSLKTFGLLNKNDYWANIKKVGCFFTELDFWGKFEISTSLLGKHNAYNIIAAISVAIEFGIDLENCKNVLSEFKPIKGRMDYYSFGDVDIIDDSYNSNPVALRLALEFLSSCGANKLKIAVLGDMLELGIFAQKAHFDAGVFASGLDIDCFICYGDKMGFFIEALLANGVLKNKVHYLTADIVTDVLYKLLGPDIKKALLLFKASRSMRIDLVLEQFKENISKKNAV